jgi:peptidoglycan/LPS O-acetylase OafA/YrhL
LFAIGAMGASLGFSSRLYEKRWRERIPWVPISVVSFVLFMITDIASKKAFVNRLGFDIIGSAPMVTDGLLAIAVVSALITLTEQWKRGDTRGVLKFLHLPPVLKLGTFSYSLYLIHPPIVGLLTLLAMQLNLTSWPAYAFMVFIGVPVCVIGAYLFHLVFERPFMPTYLAKPDNAVLPTTKVARANKPEAPAAVEQPAITANTLTVPMPATSDQTGQD